MTNPAQTHPAMTHPAMTTQTETETAHFWSSFYRTNRRRAPSPFAVWCLDEQLTPESRILELGCGNGRDSFAFLENGLSVLAVDGCAEAIAANQSLLGSPKGQLVSGRFAQLDLRHLAQLPALLPDWFADESPITIYSRFVLHAVPESIEDAILLFCEQQLPSGCTMLHEFRTIHDPLMQQGVAVSAYERITDHYRRFIDAEAFRYKLAQRGWRETFFTESADLAVFGTDNPVVARMVVTRA